MAIDAEDMREALPTVLLELFTPPMDPGAIATKVMAAECPACYALVRLIRYPEHVAEHIREASVISVIASAIRIRPSDRVFENALIEISEITKEGVFADEIRNYMRSVGYDCF